MHDDLSFVPLKIRTLADLKYFFFNQLEKKDQRLFMPHPKFSLLSYPIYFYLLVLHYFKFSYFELVYHNIEKKPIGLILLRNLNHHQAELGIALATQWQGRGLSHKLMDKIFERAKDYKLKSLFLTVEINNHAAINLYQKFGFDRVKTVNKLTLSGLRQELYMVKNNLEV